MRLCVALLLTTGLVVVGAPGSKEAPKKAEPPPLVGEWECTAVVVGGQNLPPPEAARIAFTADGKFRSDFGGERSAGTYRADTTKDPAELDLATEKAADAKSAIFKVEDGVLTICAAEGNGGRPATFGSPAGSRVTLLTYKRAEKAKD
jgi:uncharacterized protein (TIGR03067 family)